MLGQTVNIEASTLKGHRVDRRRAPQTLAPRGVLAYRFLIHA